MIQCTEAPWLPEMRLTVTRGLKRKKLANTSGGRVTGMSNELKESEHYCEAFGQRAAFLHSAAAGAG